MEYLLKTSAIIVIFYGCYMLFLQRDTFFEQNRWFLLIGLFASFFLPFLVIPIYVETAPLDLSAAVFDTEATRKNIEKPFLFLDYLPVIYGLGVTFFSIRFLVQFVLLALVIFKNKGEKTAGYTYLKTTNNVSPFSFFKWIVFNPEKFSETELNHIITHEKVHANQRHSIDILFSNLACIVLWFNPIIWLYNKALKQNLEFIADKETATRTHCKKSYQYTLLKTSMPSHQMALSTNFYNSLIKKRIVMLHKSRSKKINQLKYALIIPVLGLFLMSFNTEEVYVEKTAVHFEKPNQDKPPLYIVDGKETPKKEAESIQPENIASVNVLKGKVAIEKYGNKGKNGVIEITTKAKETAINNSKSLPEVKVIGNRNKPDGKNPLYIIDGKEMDLDIMNNIDPNTIDKIDVLKGEHATRQYGEKGKNGVVLITSKKQEWETEFIIKKPFDSISKSKNSSKNTIKLSDEAFYLIDGKEAKKEDLDKLNPDDIVSVNVYKDDTATKKYGDKGKHGVIEILTKNKN